MKIRKILKHGICFVSMLFALYGGVTLVTYLPFSDTVKGAILLVSLILGVVGEIAINAMRGRNRANTKDT